MSNLMTLTEAAAARIDAAAGDTDTTLDVHRNAPTATAAMLYGLAGDVGRAASAGSEANRYAVTLNFCAFLSAAVGRDVFLDVGDTKHHCRLFTMHVGRTSRGRKGDALALVKRIRAKAEEINESLNGLTDPFCGGLHSGGLSTREGLIMMLHDGYEHGKDVVEPINDKRMLVIESEAANVFHQSKRDGNTLSAALRDAWDGVSMKPAIKGAPRIGATDPHICVIAGITPGELIATLAAK